MTIFLMIAFVVLLIARKLFGYYADVVPVFGSLLTTLTWLTVGAGVLALAFMIAKLYAIIKGKKE